MRNHKVVDCRNCQARLNSIFCELEDSEIVAINDNKGCSSYKSKQVVFNQGSMPHGLFVIFSGKAKIFQSAENGREQIIRMAKAGDVLGYRALLSNDRYKSTAETIETSNICFIPKELFFSMMNKNSTISAHLMKLLTHDLRHAEHKITHLAQKPVKERLAESLLYIKERYGYESDDKTISVALTREEIANIVGTATETAIRLLSELKKAKLIEFVGKKIKIIDYKGLTNIANVND